MKLSSSYKSTFPRDNKADSFSKSPSRHAWCKGKLCWNSSSVDIDHTGDSLWCSITSVATVVTQVIKRKLYVNIRLISPACRQSAFFIIVYRTSGHRRVPWKKSPDVKNRWVNQSTERSVCHCFYELFIKNVHVLITLIYFAKYNHVHFVWLFTMACRKCKRFILYELIVS